MKCPKCDQHQAPDDLEVTYYEDSPLKVRSIRCRSCGRLLGGEGDLQVDPQKIPKRKVD